MTRCPTLSELPPPPPGKTGWPWTEDSLRVPDRIPDGNAWPRISIVTPSYNQGQFIEETIRSVLLQGYPDMEYIIIDGASDDGAVETIKKYERWLAYWVSEKDNGQSAAINAGFRKASGDVFAWLNSDDVFFPEAMATVGQWFSGITQPSVLVGSGDIIGADGEFLREILVPPLDTETIVGGEKWFLQQSCFWSNACWQEIGGLDEELELLMDLDLWVRFSKQFALVPCDKKLGMLRWYGGAKTVKYRTRSIAERVLLDFRYGGTSSGLSRVEDLAQKLHAKKQELIKIKSGLVYRVLKRIRAL